jgi:hypothetical protein
MLRKKRGYEFTGGQLWNICRMMIAANGFLQENQMKHGDIRPGNMVKLHEGQYKLFENVRDSPGEGQKVAFMKRMDLYSSPILFKAFCLGDYKPEHNKHKSDVFSLGLALLETGLLKSIQGIFDRRKKALDVTELNELIQQFEYRYVEEFELCQAIRSMLIVSESDRPDFLELRSKYALNLGLKELADSNIWAKEPENSAYENEAHSRTHHNPAFTALGMNTAQNPIAKREDKYGTNYMDFDEDEPPTDYWASPNPAVVKEKKLRLKSNPLTGSFFSRKTNSGGKNSPNKPKKQLSLGGITIKNPSPKKTLQLNNLRYS